MSTAWFRRFWLWVGTTIQKGTRWVRSTGREDAPYATWSRRTQPPQVPGVCQHDCKPTGKHALVRGQVCDIERCQKCGKVFQPY